MEDLDYSLIGDMNAQIAAGKTGEKDFKVYLTDLELI